MRRFLKKPVLGIVFIVLGVVVAAYALFGGKNEPSFETVRVARGTVREEVLATGRVKPSETIELAFEGSGKINRVQVRVGDHVVAGGTLAALESANTAADISREEARVATANAALAQLIAARAAKQASLDEVLRGSRPEEISIAEVKVSNAQSALDEAKKRLITTMKDAYTTGDDAVHNKADQLFSNPNSPQPTFNFTLSDSQLKITIENSRFKSGTDLLSWKTSLASLTPASDVNAAARDAHEKLDYLVAFFDALGTAVNRFTPNASLSQTTIDGYKSAVANSRSALNAAKTNVNADTEKVRSSEAALTLAQNELALTRAGSTEQTISAARAAVSEADANIAAQKARVKEAEAGLASARATAGKLVLRAPISGVITSVAVAPGELAVAGTPAITLISDSAFEIEVRVPEVDIPTIQVGADAIVTLDAYGDDVTFDASVVSIDPAESIVDGVATYLTTLAFKKTDERIRSGMTANVAVLVAQKDDTLVVPARAIVRDGDSETVRIVVAGTPSVVPVTTGIRGVDGMVEIVEGVQEGDEVVTFEEE